ncbi:hypothetical protein OF122_14135 [Pelagibacterium flavum]|uniref:DUF47 domain-containing protein n=1 Tax=Pelagibacterium flavum TaxID=2984530 RepID=A0ABY6INA3_9HYPH|nr:hypothetical protein [Pelagibacterium sp. YIM 151497]UYQ71180.1 hypothetical protein OF122_14135 [Pelagibacterium sp. YIM 151497]
MLVLSQNIDTEASKDITSRLRSILADLAPQCACHDELDAALVRFTQSERTDDLKRRLAQARDARDLIRGLVELLAELDEIDADEPDKTAFDELGLLFKDIETAALRGARLLTETLLAPNP